MAKLNAVVRAVVVAALLASCSGSGDAHRSLEMAIRTPADPADVVVEVLNACPGYRASYGQPRTASKASCQESFLAGELDLELGCNSTPFPATDLVAGQRVTIRNGRGEVAGVGELRESVATIGAWNELACDFEAFIAVQPAEFYEISVGGRMWGPFSEQEVTAGAIYLSLG